MNGSLACFHLPCNSESFRSGFDHGPLLVTVMLHELITITNYQMAPSKRGAGGGSATHKEPT